VGVEAAQLDQRPRPAGRPPVDQREQQAADPGADQPERDHGRTPVGVPFGAVSAEITA
jgi:hypothetical protein